MGAIGADWRAPDGGDWSARGWRDVGEGRREMEETLCMKVAVDGERRARCRSATVVKAWGLGLR